MKMFVNTEWMSYGPLNRVKNVDGYLTFERLAKVALLVLTIPHSKAQEERFFSLVTKNKIKFRPSLKLNGTLASILTIKLQIQSHAINLNHQMKLLNLQRRLL